MDSSSGNGTNQRDYDTAAASAGNPTPTRVTLSGQEFWTSDPAAQCTCDSILSRLIYGYKTYRRTMETLQIQPANAQRYYPLMMY